ncbi:MAG: peptidoglycan DD-metalloendopeptidase family protein [Rickettsiales endosymbiont of Dermacentor nuttalli]
MRFQNLHYLYLRILSLYLIIALSICAIPVTFSFKQDISLSPEKLNHIWNMIYDYSNRRQVSIPKDHTITLSIQKGDTLSTILRNNNVTSSETAQIIQALQRIYNLKKLSIGQSIILYYSYAEQDNIELESIPTLQTMRIKTDYSKEIEVYRTNSGFDVREIAIPVIKRLTRVRGVINNSFISTALSLGIPANALTELTKSYSYDVDFQRDIQTGNELEVIFEKYYDNNGTYSHDGDIIYSSLILNDKKLDLYKYTNSAGITDFYTANGTNIRRELLKTPLNVIRVSSGFGIRRHPVLGYTKMHKGVDFVAPIGTPIFAAGSGTIEEIGRKGSYGNYIRIRHSNGYATAYAHASSFAKNLRKGSQVKQGEVIAYVGATGRATGPHLHYEVLYNNQQINPLKLKLVPNNKLDSKELTQFMKFKQKLDRFVLSIPDQGEIVATVFEKY